MGIYFSKIAILLKKIFLYKWLMLIKLTLQIILVLVDFGIMKIK